MVQFNGDAPKLRLVIVTHQPAPYRNPVHERLSRQADIDLHVIYCTRREPDRSWALEPLNFSHEILPERLIAWKGRFIHTNPGTWHALQRARPDVLVSTGFNPTHLVSFAYAKSRGLPFIAQTDGTKHAEDTALTLAHRLVRSLVFKSTQAFIGASEGAFSLYRDYGIPDRKMFKSHLCADNGAFQQARQLPKSIDLLFSARLIAIKNPFFALDVAAGTARRLGRRVSMAVLGDGVLEQDIRLAAAKISDLVDVRMAGFVAQEDLPDWFGRSRLFLFPTRWDPWGVVANEATAAGVPTLVSPHAGAAQELIRDGVNGRVLELSQDAWVDAATEILSSPEKWAALSSGCAEMAREFNFDNSAEGIAEAARYACGRALHGNNPQILPMSLRPAPSL